MNNIHPFVPFTALLDECLERIAIEKYAIPVAKWVERFAGLPRLVHCSAENLCDQGIL